MKQLLLASFTTAAVAFGAANAQVLPEELEPVRGVAFDGSALVEDSCQVLTTNPGESPELRDVPGMHVLGRSLEDPLVLFSGDDVKINAVVCWRSAARFASNDYLVPDKLGYPLYVKTEGGQNEAGRTLVLEKVGGSYRVRLLSGPQFGESEKQEIIRVLGYFNKQTADAPNKRLESDALKTTRASNMALDIQTT